MPVAWASLVISSFLPAAVPYRRAVNFFWLDGGDSTASRFQYSSGLKFSISFSRSTISRTATLCTRPADRPRRTLRHRNGLSL